MNDRVVAGSQGLVSGGRLGFQDVQRGERQPTTLQCSGQVGRAHNRPPRHVDQDRALLHLCNGFLAYQMLRGGDRWAV